MADSDDKYTVKEISDDPQDYITGPRRGEASRTHGGTTRDGQVQVVNTGDSSDK